jgi:hypothetical protein
MKGMFDVVSARLHPSTTKAGQSTLICSNNFKGRCAEVSGGKTKMQASTRLPFDTGPVPLEVMQAVEKRRDRSLRHTPTFTRIAKGMCHPDRDNCGLWRCPLPS